MVITTDEENLCINCYNPITDPVCLDCHLRSVWAWLSDKDYPPIARAVVLKSIKRAIKKESESEHLCVLCKKNYYSLCAYYFFLTSARTLRELNFSEKLIEDFLYTFDYSKSHEEYEV